MEGDGRGEGGGREDKFHPSLRVRQFFEIKKNKKKSSDRAELSTELSRGLLRVIHTNHSKQMSVLC
jgi:hypothetical protein